MSVLIRIRFAQETEMRPGRLDGVFLVRLRSLFFLAIDDIVFSTLAMQAEDALTSKDDTAGFAAG